jgi:undecaprenyl-diphosphatase
MERTTSLAAEALLGAAIDAAILKEVSQRVRPAAGGTGEFFVRQPEPGQEPSSFPSGHAMGAFAVAAVFARSYADKPAVPWIAYGGATLISLSRIALGRHFPSDVLVGAVLGHSIGAMVVHRHGDGPAAGRPVSLEPLVSEDGHGFGLMYRHAW